jgi:enoyl-CoA hydratase/carnithine racemase
MAWIVGAAPADGLIFINRRSNRAAMLARMIALDLDGALAVATLSRAPVNAIDEQWLARLDDVLSTVQAVPGVAVLLVRSTERAFSAGADLALMKSRFDSAEGRTRMVSFVREIQRVYARLEGMSQVTIAEIGAPALGGGLELALSCDLRIASDDARLGLPETRLGLLPGAGGTQRLTRIAGEAAAKRIILGAEVVSGTQAAALGIVQWSAPAAYLATRARTLAAEIASLPAAALAEAKHCIAAAIARDPGGYEMELDATGTLLARTDTQERVRSFLEKRR